MIHHPLRIYFILLIYIIIVVLYHLFAYTGHFGYDDLHYAELAADLLKGTVNFEDHYAYRFPIILFTSLFYLLFGISDLSSSLPALAITLTILIIVFNILKEHGPKVIFIGLSLCTLSNWFLFYSDKLMPDIYVTLSVIWALAIIHQYKYYSEKDKPLLHAFLLALSLLFGFMSKGTIILIIPLLIFLVLSDIFQRRDLRFWGYTLLSAMVLGSLYLFVIWVVTGNPFKRFDAITSNSYLNLCSYDQQSLRILLKRILLGFFELAIFQSLATGFIFVFASLFQRKGLQVFRMEDSFAFFRVSAIILFLSSSFMTISLTSYAPMCLDPRHYLFLVPVAAIPAAHIIAEFMENKKNAIQIVVALFSVALISFFLPGNSFWKLYLPLTALFLIYILIKAGNHKQRLFILLFTLILLLIPMEMIPYAQQVNYRKQKAIVEEQVLKNDQENVIVTDEVQKRLLDYYSGYKTNQVKRFVSFEAFERGLSAQGKTLLLLNWYTRYLSGMEENDLPFYARKISPDMKPVFENEDLRLVIYEMKDLPRMEQNVTLLITTFNDFEKSIPFWKQNEKDFSADIKYAGKQSNRIPEFSSTFEFAMDSLNTSDFLEFQVQCNLFINASDKTETKVIVSLENENGSYFWKALEVNRYLKAYSNWWPLEFDVIIPQKDLKPGSLLKIYVWKSDNTDVFIDNFAIKISGSPVP